MNGTGAPWDDPAYETIEHATYEDGTLAVRFANGDEVRLDAQRLLPSGTEGADWTRITWDASAVWLPARAPEAEIGIPADRLRVLSDAGFQAHMAEVARREARRIGHRLAELRRARGLQSKDVAQRAGIAPRSLSRIEHGGHDVVASTLAPILAAMGCTWEDLLTPRRRREFEEVHAANASAPSTTGPR